MRAAMSVPTVFRTASRRPEARPCRRRPPRMTRRPRRRPRIRRVRARTVRAGRPPRAARAPRRIRPETTPQTGARVHRPEETSWPAIRSSRTAPAAKPATSRETPSAVERMRRVLRAARPTAAAQQTSVIRASCASPGTLSARAWGRSAARPSATWPPPSAPPARPPVVHGSRMERRPQASTRSASARRCKPTGAPTFGGAFGGAPRCGGAVVGDSSDSGC